jgi:hypothetical protein
MASVFLLRWQNFSFWLRMPLYAEASSASSLLRASRMAFSTASACALVFWCAAKHVYKYIYTYTYSSLSILHTRITCTGFPEQVGVDFEKQLPHVRLRGAMCVCVIECVVNNMSMCASE